MGSRLPDPEVEAAVVAFFDDLFRAVFSEPFARDLAVDRLRRRAVERQVEAVADASSQAITRFFHNERLRLDEVERILAGWSTLRERIAIEDVANVNVTPESLAERLGPDLGCPAEVTNARQEAVYRFALHTVMQVLMLAGPVMAEWRRLNFATSFALVQQVVQRLDQIGTLLAVGRSGQETADERYGLSYRGHLLLRFNRVEAGTVRMTTNMAVDLRELFVMPKVRACPKVQRDVEGSGLMLLAEARLGLKPSKKDDAGRPVLDEVRERPRMVLVGAPGSGKSSFLEWLQLQLAEAVEELVLGDQQAIPLLLRVRQLDPKAMPEGSGMIERATLSKQIATLMPPGWLDRQMAKGRVLVMVDGLDEVDPDARKKHILPWLTAVATPRAATSSPPGPWGTRPARSTNWASSNTSCSTSTSPPSSNTRSAGPRPCGSRRTSPKLRRARRGVPTGSGSWPGSRSTRTSAAWPATR